VGPGGSLDAAFDLRASVAAGTYHVQCDAIVLASVDVTFTLIWRRGTADTTLAQWMQHFDPSPDGYEAQPYEVDMPAIAIDFAPGDQLVFRYAGANTDNNQAFIPNGDGQRAGGRIPAITLP
jgi:hypothetical protein